MRNCCRRLGPGAWDRRFWSWDDKPFYRATYLTFFNIPLNLDSVVEKAVEEIGSHNLWTEPMIYLGRDETAFHSSVLISVSRFTDQLPIETLSGRYYSRLFQGPYADSGKYVRETKTDLREQGSDAGETYMYHATCPRCIGEGKPPQTVVFAEVE